MLHQYKTTEEIHDEVDLDHASLFFKSERNVKGALALLTGLIRDRSSLDKKNFDFAAWKTKVVRGLRRKYSEEQLTSEGFHAFLDTAIQKVRQENLIEELNKLDAKSDFLTAMRQNNTKLLEYKKNLVHTNKRWDSFWRLENTATWQETMRVIRDNAKKQLNLELIAIDEKHDSNPENRANCMREQMELLKEVVKLEIFNKHRSNYFFTGAFGQTDIVGKINEKIKAHQRYLDNYEKNRPIVVNSR